MSTNGETQKQLSVYVKRLTTPEGILGIRPDMSTLSEKEYSRRPLAGLLHDTIGVGRSPVDLAALHVEAGLRDEPSTGKQPVLDLDFGSGAVWLTGPPKSGKSHGLRCILHDWTERNESSVVIHLNGDASNKVESTGRSPVYFDEDDLNAQALVIRQIWARHFQQAGPYPVLLVVERVDLLLRAFTADERTYENLLDLLRDGVTRSVYCCVTAAVARDSLLVGGAQEIRMVRRADSPLPYARPEPDTWAMFYRDPGDPKRCGPSEGPDKLGVPRRPTLDGLAERIEGDPRNGQVPIGIDWLSHEPVWIGRSSLAISGDDAVNQDVSRLVGQLFTASDRTVVQLKGARDPDYLSCDAATQTLHVVDWTVDRIVKLTELIYGGVLLVPNIDTKADVLSDISSRVAAALAKQDWIVVASAVNAGATLYENPSARTRYLSNYSQCLWLRTLDRGNVSLHGGPDRFPVWPRPVSEDDGDAYLLRTDGYSQTIRMLATR